MRKGRWIASSKRTGPTTHTPILLSALLLPPLGALHAADAATGRVGSVPFVARQEGYVAYRCPTLAVSVRGTVLAFCEGTGYSDIGVMPDASVGLLYRRGDVGHPVARARRYDEVGCTVVPFAAIVEPQPRPPGGDWR